MFWKRKKKTGHTSADPDISPDGYTEVWGEHIHAARHYRSLAVFLSGVALVLAVALFISATRPDPLPLVVRVDSVGRAEVVDYDAERVTAAPDDPVIPYFLTQFIQDHYSRRRVVGTERWGRSLYFLRQDVAREAAATDRQEFTTFLSSSSAPERFVESFQLRLIPQPEPPFAAEVQFDLVYRVDGAPVSRTAMTVSLRYIIAAEVPDETRLINPLGIVIVYMDETATVLG